MLKADIKQIFNKNDKIFYHKYFIGDNIFIELQAEGPGVARGKIEFFKLIHECPQKCQPIRSSCLAGLRKQIYECLVLLYR